MHQKYVYTPTVNIGSKMTATMNVCRILPRQRFAVAIPQPSVIVYYVGINTHESAVGHFAKPF